MRKEIEKLTKEAEGKIAEIIAQLEKDSGLEVTKIGHGKGYSETEGRYITSSVSLELTWR